MLSVTSFHDLNCWIGVIRHIADDRCLTDTNLFDHFALVMIVPVQLPTSLSKEWEFP